VFDGPARADRCAQAIASSIPRLGIAIRAGVHTGEVEFFGDNVRGLAVHEAARVAGVAMPGEVLVSAPTKHMLAGAGLKFKSAGNFELKGLGDARETVSPHRIQLSPRVPRRCRAPEKEGCIGAKNTRRPGYRLDRLE